MSTQTESAVAGAGVERSIDEQIGEIVHHVMWRKRVSQVAIAPALGIGQSAVSRKLRGQNPWSVADLYAAAGALGVEVGELLPRLDSNQQPFD